MKISVEQAGLKKSSFELNYGGGTIWCEHLDAMGNNEQAVIEKFRRDIPEFSKPSVSSRMIINLQETGITDGIIAELTDTLKGLEKRFARIALVGFGWRERRRYRKQWAQMDAVVCFHRDYEKAKEWIFGKQ